MSYCKVTIFKEYLISYLLSFEKVQNLSKKKFFGFEALEFRRHFCLRPSKVRKLVCTNQLQVESTEMDTGRISVTLQYQSCVATRCGVSYIIHVQQKGMFHEHGQL